MSDSIEVSLLSFLSLYVAAEWSLSPTQLASITAVVFTGSLIGASVIWGPIADRYGRRVSFLLGSYLVSICSLASALSSNFLMLILFRFFVGVGVGCGFVAFDLLAEFLPSSHRGQYLMNINYFWTMGSMIVNGTAWIFLDSYGWRVFTAISTIPVLLGAIFATLYLPESPRWFLHQQRVKEAENAIYDAALQNGTKIDSFHLILTSSTYSKLPSSTHSISPSHPDDPQYLVHSTTENMLHTSRIESNSEGINNVEEDYKSTPPSHSSSQQQQQQQPKPKPPMDHHFEASSWDHYLQLLQGDYLSITIPLWIIYLSYGFTYYGAILFISRLYSSESNDSSSSSSSSSDHQIISFNYFEIFTNACSEIIGIIFASNIIDRIGRKPSQLCLYFTSAISILLLPFTTSHLRYFLSLISRISILAATGITWVATPELYPTNLRAVGHSLCTAFSRIGALISPYVIQNHLINEKYIGIILCGVNLISMLSIAHLPETQGKDMESIKGHHFHS